MKIIIFFLMGFIYRVELVLQALWSILTETINILKKIA